MRQGRTTGSSLALLSAAAFGTSGTFGSALIDSGWSAGAVVTARVLVAALVLLVPAAVALRRSGAGLRRLRPVVGYGIVAVAGCQLAYFNAIEHLSVAVALLMEYSGALLVVAWLWARHGQRPRPLTAAGGVLALGGLALVLDLQGDAEVDGVGLLWGATAAVGLAVYFVLSAADEDALPPVVVAGGGLLVGALVLLAAGAVGVLPVRTSRADVVLLDTPVDRLVPLLGLSLVAAVVAYLSGIAAARLLGATVASFVGLTEVLFAVLFAWVALGESLAPVQLVGGALVLVGVALVRLDGRQAAPAEPVLAAV